MDTHNVILILVSSSLFNSLFRRLIKFLISIVSSSLFPGVPTFFNYISMEIHLNHCKASTLFFSSSISTDHFFYYRSSHEGSTRWYIKDLIPSRSVHRDSFLRSSSFLHILIRSAFFLPYYWRWYYAILDNLSSCFMIHMLSRMRYFKSIIFFIGIILGYISPKAFL